MQCVQIQLNGVKVSCSCPVHQETRLVYCIEICFIQREAGTELSRAVQYALCNVNKSWKGALVEHLAVVLC